MKLHQLYLLNKSPDKCLHVLLWDDFHRYFFTPGAMDEYLPSFTLINCVPLSIYVPYPKMQPIKLASFCMVLWPSKEVLTILLLQLILLLFSCNLYFNVCTIHFMFINFSLFNISLSVYSCRVAFPNKRHKNSG